MKYQYKFIGWCREDNSDKVWIAIDLSEGNINWAQDRPYVTIWGRRGKKLQHKVVRCSSYDMGKLASSKKDKGYKEVYKDELDRVYPEFESDLEKTAFWATLKV